eukprot:6711631-Prymnesium_polylepis.2
MEDYNSVDSHDGSRSCPCPLQHVWTDAMLLLHVSRSDNIQGIVSIGGLERCCPFTSVLALLTPHPRMLSLFTQTKAAIRKLARRGGCKRISFDLFESHPVTAASSTKRRVRAKTASNSNEPLIANRLTLSVVRIMLSKVACSKCKFRGGLLWWSMAPLPHSCPLMSSPSHITLALLVFFSRFLENVIRDAVCYTEHAFTYQRLNSSPKYLIIVCLTRTCPLLPLRPGVAKQSWPWMWFTCVSADLESPSLYPRHSLTPNRLLHLTGFAPSRPHSLRYAYALSRIHARCSSNI